MASDGFFKLRLFSAMYLSCKDASRWLLEDLMCSYSRCCRDIAIGQPKRVHRKNRDNPFYIILS